MNAYDISRLRFRRARLQAERVKTRVELAGEHHLDRALDLHTAETLEGGGDDLDIEVRLAFGGRAGVPGVAGAVVDDFQKLRLESFLKLLPNPLNPACQFLSP